MIILHDQLIIKSFDYIITNYLYIIFIYMICYVIIYIYIYDMLATSNINYIITN
jgi:hypothetical protein